MAELEWHQEKMGIESNRGILTADQLRREISARNLDHGREFGHEVSYGPSASVIFHEADGVHGNFLPASWRRIQADPAWKQRMAKVYTANRYVPRAQDRRRGELDCANSSDALLMYIFCYPGVLRRPQLCSLLGVSAGLRPEFGFRPATPLAGGKADRTEIDMRLGDLLVEAKLTEGDFQRGPARLLARYRDTDEVFDTERLRIANGSVDSWQLVRGVLAAHALASSFFVFCDSRRPDLMERWFEVMGAVRPSSLRTRLGLRTWQEIGATLPKAVRRFLGEKYGI
ncbi:MAG: hypothetical protein WBD46_19320 [Acidobacteriaceae bacterium]